MRKILNKSNIFFYNTYYYKMKQTKGITPGFVLITFLLSMIFMAILIMLKEIYD